MNDLNYFPLDVESNIYGMTTLNFDDRSSKVLVATIDCRIFCINYSKFKSYTREVEFTYIPSGAKIISIGALKRGPNDFVIGITHSLAPNAQKGTARSSTSFSGRETGEYGRSTTYYFNIYASGSISSNFDIDYVAQGCQTIRLRYVPYQLYHTDLITIVDSSTDTVRRKPYWLLLGGDNSAHAFCEDKPYQSFAEVPIEECFPELSNIPSLALWIDVMNIRSDFMKYERVVALGFEDGSVRLYHSILSKSSGKFELIRESSFDNFTTIIPSVRLFKVNSTVSSTLRELLISKNILKETKNKSTDHLNLLVVSSTENSIVFRDVLNEGLNKKFELPGSKRLDCSVTSAVDDIDLDGQNELLIGTHGRELLTFHYDTRSDEYYLAQLSELNHPIFAISILDLTGDAIKDVAILLASGVLIRQTDIKNVIEICRRRVDTILSSLK